MSKVTIVLQAGEGDAITFEHEADLDLSAMFLDMVDSVRRAQPFRDFTDWEQWED